MYQVCPVAFSEGFVEKKEKTNKQTGSRKLVSLV